MLVYFVLLVYLTATFKPILPVATDLLAHAFWKANHIESIHHQHGSHHLQSEITQAERQNDTNQNNSALKFSEPVALHLVAVITYDLSRSVAGMQYSPAISHSLYNTNLESIYPPPKSC